MLIVGEVLSVSDIAFQNKCMGRIRTLRAPGVSFPFVSHDLNTLQMICDRAAVIVKGEVVAAGHVHELVGHGRTQVR